MEPREGNYIVATLAIAIIATIFVSSFSVAIVEPDGSVIEWPDKPLSAAWRLDPPAEEPSIEPDYPDHGFWDDFICALRDDSIDEIPTLEEIRHLAELEGKQEFTNILPTWYWTRWDMGCCDAASYAIGDEGTRSAEQIPALPTHEVPDSSEPDRDMEEADLVKLVGDLLYVLNPYRGLLIIDLSNPDDPVLLGRAPVLGTPVDMYVVGSRAYVITSKDFNFWYQYASVRTRNIEGRSDVAYRIGSQVAIVDVANPASPSIMNELGVEGFITDSRRIGDVIYFVSSCYSWYSDHSIVEAKDQTFVMSIDMEDPKAVSVVDIVSFYGGSNHIHTSRDYIFVAQPGRDDETSSTITTVTIVDISDPNGDISVRGDFDVSGAVEDRFQLDYYLGTFRVVSHGWVSTTEGSREMSELWTFDVSNPDKVIKLAQMVIDDEGTLMATRFAGERAYTIHLPRIIRVDPLDVLDLSDPAEPKLCDVLEIPGWVTHIEVRGMKLLAMGVADVNEGGVAVSLFDVSDPWNAVLEDRVQIGEGVAWSQANWDPKALTVLDDRGLLLVPFACSYWDDSLGMRSVNGVQIVKFDLDAGILRAAGSFEHPDAVTRTLSVGKYVFSTSINLLQAVDLHDPDRPEVKATVELCPVVLDVHVHGELTAEIVQLNSNNRIILRVRSTGGQGSHGEEATYNIDDSISRWIWLGGYLYLFNVYEENDVYWANITVIDLSVPTLASRYAFNVPGPDYARTYGWESDIYYDYYDYSYSYSSNGYYQEGSFDNPFLVDEGLMVYFNTGTIYVIDLSWPSSPRLAAWIPVDCIHVQDLRAMGRTVLLTNYIEVDDTVEGWYIRAGKYYLHRIDLTEPTKPRVLETVNIPGVPIGTGSLGSIIYTRARWWFNPDRGIVETINVVDIGERTATIISAHDLGNYGMLVVENDKAIVVRYDSSWSTTDLEVIDLLYEDGEEVTSSVTLEGAVSSLTAIDGYIFLSFSDEDGLLVYNIGSEGNLAEIGFFQVDRTIDAIKMAGGTAYIVQGLYGLASLNLV